ncbi:hypothetical protein HDU76_006222 [Blyttiomyces sp. JEL0837]|nr:hypothetical protein HDU76_006222 [Blyttiomyces sp. JEL0837]
MDNAEATTSSSPVEGTPAGSTVPVVSETSTGEAQNQSQILTAGVKSTGLVKFFNAQKGYGFIIDEKGGPEVFVHHTSILSPDGGFRSLAEGETVEYVLEDGPKGLHAVNVSGPNGAPVKGDSQGHGKGSSGTTGQTRNRKRDSNANGGGQSGNNNFQGEQPTNVVFVDPAAFGATPYAGPQGYLPHPWMTYVAPGGNPMVVPYGWTIIAPTAAAGMQPQQLSSVPMSFTANGVPVPYVTAEQMSAAGSTAVRPSSPSSNTSSGPTLIAMRGMSTPPPSSSHHYQHGTGGKFASGNTPMTPLSMGSPAVGGTGSQQTYGSVSRSAFPYYNESQSRRPPSRTPDEMLSGGLAGDNAGFDMSGSTMYPYWGPNSGTNVNNRGSTSKTGSSNVGSGFQGSIVTSQQQQQGQTSVVHPSPSASPMPPASPVYQMMPYGMAPQQPQGSSSGTAAHYVYAPGVTYFPPPHGY